jgi:3-keto-disaccharide hydrolase
MVQIHSPQPFFSFLPPTLRSPIPFHVPAVPLDIVQVRKHKVHARVCPAAGHSVKTERWFVVARRNSVCAVLMAALALARIGGAVPAKSHAAESRWVALFNGTNLSGWKNNGDEKWVVEDGTILCESAANKYGYLTTEKTYRDFDLRLKFKGEAAGNSGVFFHARIIGMDPDHGPDIEGMQVEVDPNVGKHTGGLYESGGRGWVAMPTPQGEKALKPGEWNDLEVSVRADHIVTRLNATTVADYKDATPKFTDGVVGLQIHTGGGVRMRWKDIFILEK